MGRGPSRRWSLQLTGAFMALGYTSMCVRGEADGCVRLHLEHSRALVTVRRAPTTRDMGHVAGLLAALARRCSRSRLSHTIINRRTIDSA